jgi:hypothetical protein
LGRFDLSAGLCGRLEAAVGGATRADVAGGADGEEQHAGEDEEDAADDEACDIIIRSAR